MNPLRLLTFRLRALLQRTRIERELDDELRHHLDLASAENVKRGLPPEEARRAALLAFGGVERVKDEYRDSWGVRALETLLQDVRYGIARRIEQVSDDILKLNEGTVYAALMRLQHQRCISASWGASENNRKAKFYAITEAGRLQLAREVETWDRLATLISRLRGAEQA
jgi:hypothetical protein